jgi:hypothetical protein
MSEVITEYRGGDPIALSKELVEHLEIMTNELLFTGASQEDDKVKQLLQAFDLATRLRDLLTKGTPA